MIWGKPTIFGNPHIYHLESRWLAIPMHWFIMAPYPKPPFGSCAIYSHYSARCVVKETHSNTRKIKQTCWTSLPSSRFHHHLKQRKNLNPEIKQKDRISHIWLKLIELHCRLPYIRSKDKANNLSSLVLFWVKFSGCISSGW